MNEVNYFAKCPNFLKKYFFNKSVQKNPVVVVCIYYSFLLFLKKYNILYFILFFFIWLLKNYLYKKKIYFLISVRFKKKDIILWMK